MNRKSSRSKNRTWPTPRDERILRAVASHCCLTGDHIRRLFFGRGAGFAARQTVGARLRKPEYLAAEVVDGGRGAGPYAYQITRYGTSRIGIAKRIPRGRPQAPRHALKVADFRVALEVALRIVHGSLDWTTESELRQTRQGERPIPDGMAHWQLDGRQGVLAVEVDLGTESFATLVHKLDAYEHWWRSRRYRTTVPGIRTKPRLAIVTTAPRARRLVAHIIDRRRALTGTIAIAPMEVAFATPLDAVWWRSDAGEVGRLLA